MDVDVALDTVRPLVADVRTRGYAAARAATAGVTGKPMRRSLTRGTAAASTSAT